MICTLCLKEIEEHEKTVTVNGRIRHQECHDKLEDMISELEKIYEDEEN